MQKGQILIISVIFLTVMLVLMGALLGFVGQNVLATRRAVAAEQALQLADAGVDKAIWQLNETGGYSGETNTVLGGGVLDIAIADLSASAKEIAATGYVPNKTAPRATRRVRVQVSIDTTNVNFAYAVQVGPGGLEMSNSSRINGNAFVAGLIDGANSARITGDAYAAGASGRIEDMQIDGTARAHTIEDSTIGGNARGNTLTHSTVGGNAYEYAISSCTIGGNAWYTTKSGCTIGGNETSPYPGESDPVAPAFPITDQQITDWKAAAAAGGTLSGDYTLGQGNLATLGPKKISGDLTMTNSSTLVLSGPLWVTGNITLTNNAKIRLAASYGGLSEVIVADGNFSTSNSVTYRGAGSGSYIMMLTTSSSNDAIIISNSAESLIAYAPDGTARISNTAQLKQLTANRLMMTNSSQLNYESGLADVNFTSGPGGSWTLVRGTYR